MTISTIWKSDFKDFKGLHPAVMDMTALKRREIYTNFIIIDNLAGQRCDRTPFDLIEAFPELYKKRDKYNEVLAMAEAEGFDVERVKYYMDTLQASSEHFYRCISAAICYPVGHVNRKIF
jgi:hypothetical protein